MIIQRERPAVDRGLGSLGDVGGGLPSQASDPVRLDQLRASVEGFCVDWQLLESPPPGVEGPSSAHAVGGWTA